MVFSRIVFGEFQSVEQMRSHIQEEGQNWTKVEISSWHRSLIDLPNQERFVFIKSALEEIVKANIKNIGFHVTEKCYDVILPVLAKNPKSFEVLDFNLRNPVILEEDGLKTPVFRIFDCLKNMQVDTLKIDLNKVLGKLSKEISELKIRNLFLYLDSFKVEEIIILEKSIKQSQSIEKVNLIRGNGTRISTFEKAKKSIENLKEHLETNFRRNKFIDLFERDRTKHFLDERKGHLFTSSFLRKIQVNLEDGDKPVPVDDHLPGFSEVAGKTVAKFLTADKACRMSGTNKATYEASQGSDYTYAKMGALQRLYETSAAARPSKKQKIAES